MPEDILPTIVVDEENTTTTVAKKKRSEAVVLERENRVLERETEPKSPKPVIVGRYRSQSTTQRVMPTTTFAFAGGGGREKHLPNGDLYSGKFFGNLPHRFGKYLRADGCMYEGEWKRGKASGKRKFSWPSGATFEGEFKSGRIDGFRSFIGCDGDTYQGQLVGR